MSKKIVVISTSLRKNSNSDGLANAFIEGAQASGNEVDKISLIGKNIEFCRGCLACQQIGHCVIQDDVAAIEEKVLKADVVVWATPIYYYEMSGQMKTLIDRLNPMYAKDYAFREVYMLATAAEDAEHVAEKAVSGLEGWIACFEKARLAGTVFGGGVVGAGEISGSKALEEAYNLGKSIE